MTSAAVAHCVVPFKLHVQEENVTGVIWINYQRELVEASMQKCAGLWFFPSIPVTESASPMGVFWRSGNESAEHSLQIHIPWKFLYCNDIFKTSV